MAKLILNTLIQDNRGFVRAESRLKWFMGRNNAETFRCIGPHTEGLAREAMDFTGSLAVALACLFHQVPDGKLEKINVPQPLKDEVLRILNGYSTVKDAIAYGKNEEVSSAFFEALKNKEQFLLTVLDAWSRLVLTENRDSGIDRNALADRLLTVYSPLIHALGYHTLDSRICDAAFKVRKPVEYALVEAELFSPSFRDPMKIGACPQKEIAREIRSGKHRFNTVMRGMESMLDVFITHEGFKGHTMARVKSAYGRYLKLMRTGLEFNEAIERMFRIFDLIAARVVLTGKNNNIRSLNQLDNALRSAPFFETAKSGYLIGPRNEETAVYKNYVATPKANNPDYMAIHFLLDFAKVLDYLMVVSNAMKGLCGVNKPPLIAIELQGVTLDMYESNDHGGKARHVDYKLGQREEIGDGATYDGRVAEAIKTLDERTEVSGRIGVNVHEMGENGAAHKRKEPRPMQMTFNKSYLEAKICLSVREVFGGASIKIEDFRIADDEYARLREHLIAQGNFGKAIVDVFVDSNETQAKKSVRISMIDIKYSE